MLHDYLGSLVELITTVYPQHPWQIWKFDKVPGGYWNDKTNQEQFVRWMESELSIKHWEDWYHVSSDKIKGNNLIIFFDGV